MQTPDVLVTDIVFGEQPRWHDGRLWFSDWGTEEVIAVDADGTTEVMHRGSSFPLCVDWLPDGRMLVVDTSTARLLAQEADGSLEMYADSPSGLRSAGQQRARRRRPRQRLRERRRLRHDGRRAVRGAGGVVLGTRGRSRASPRTSSRSGAGTTERDRRRVLRHAALPPRAPTKVRLQPSCLGRADRRGPRDLRRAELVRRRPAPQRREGGTPSHGRVDLGGFACRSAARATDPRRSSRPRSSPAHVRRGTAQPDSRVPGERERGPPDPSYSQFGRQIARHRAPRPASRSARSGPRQSGGIVVAPVLVAFP